MSTRDALPERWIERLFARFVALYGAQKVGAMWEGVDTAECRRIWATELGRRFSPQTVAAAVESLTDAGGAWPPTLPEFVAICRTVAVERRVHAPAVPPERQIGATPITPEKREEARRKLAEIVERMQGRPCSTMDT